MIKDGKPERGPGKKRQTTPTLNEAEPEFSFPGIDTTIPKNKDKPGKSWGSGRSLSEGAAPSFDSSEPPLELAHSCVCVSTVRKYAFKSGSSDPNGVSGANCGASACILVELSGMLLGRVKSFAGR